MSSIITDTSHNEQQSRTSMRNYDLDEEDNGFTGSEGSCQTHISEFSGDYVKSDSRGIVTIFQEYYPTLTDTQSYEINYRPVSKMLIDEDNEMFYQVVTLDEPLRKVDMIEVDDKELPFRIIEDKEAESNPYSSCGRLEMIFPKFNKDELVSLRYRGSAAAIDRNLVITAAHNFMPNKINEHENIDRIRAEKVKFHHMLTSSNASQQYSFQSAENLETHCFIHPEWMKNFNPHYDVALLFLSDNLDHDLVKEFLKLNISEDTGRERVVGYPMGTDEMSESEREMKSSQSSDSNFILYHSANTQLGRSESSIIRNSSITDTHIRGNKKNDENSGVRIRKDLLGFINKSIKEYQSFLIGMINQEKHRSEQILIEKERIEERVKIARKMLEANMEISLITRITGLTIEQITP